MEDFEGKVAVITGAASGVGRALAERCAQEGMAVVLADIDEKALSQTDAELRAAGATVLPVVADVSVASDVETLAQKTLDAFGAVHLLCNNAGVLSVGELIRPVWRSSLADWEWVMGVNLWGVIHGVRVFVPIMLEQDTNCHIVNTASLAGLQSGGRMGIYGATKHGVVTLSETLYRQLAQEGAKVKVSLLIPGMVNTRIVDASLERLDVVRNDPTGKGISPEEAQRINATRQSVRAGMSPTEVADRAFVGIREGRFYIFARRGGKDSIRARMKDILQERNPATP